MRSFALGIATLLASVLAANAAMASGLWVTHPAAVAADADHKPVALQFRRDFDLASAPQHFMVHVSADSRYWLYVNGERISTGPARGDLRHWRYEELDLAPDLHAGANVIAAEVWSDGKFAPRAQISARTAFLMSAENKTQDVVDTGPQWRVRVDPSRTVTSGMRQIIKQLGPEYYAAGAPETLDAHLMVDDWALAHTSAKDWVSAVDAVKPSQTPPWKLVADTLPQMTYTHAAGGRVVRSHGVDASKFPNGAVTIPANTDASILLDVGAVQTAYPRLTVSGGRGAKITVTYDEALYGADKKRLHDRAQVKGGQALGLTDTFLPDGRAHVRFEPFWWREWRFVEIRVKTGDQPLTLDRFDRFSTYYPFKTRAHFVSNDPELNKIWQIGWHTVRVDAHETFMDTAYWEQLQYVGDTRIEALTVDTVSGDPRLPAQAIKAFDSSRQKYGITEAAWPSRFGQWIPPFSLLWVGIIHDDWMHQDDTGTIKDVLPGMRSVFDWYAKRVKANGLVDRTVGWNFIDWRKNLQHTPRAGFSLDPAKMPSGPELDQHKNACILTLLYIGALQEAGDLEHALGDAGRGAADIQQAARLSAAVRSHCWSPKRKLFADGPAKRFYSQQANILAVLYDVAPKAEQAAILNRIIVKNGGITPPPGITGVTYYFTFYLARALDHAGLGNRYLQLLAPWRKMLAQHFTTWPETPDPSRSDSHAWSAHPTIDLLAIVAGIEPSSPAFSSVRIAPHLGPLKTVDAAMPIPKGMVSVKYKRQGDALAATVTLPAGVAGTFVWGGKTTALHAGANTINAQEARPQ